MDTKNKRYRIPAADIRVSLQNQLDTVSAEIERQQQESEARYNEVVQHAIPALEKEHARLLEGWRELPDKVRAKTRQPKLIIDGSFSYIMVYGKATFRRTLREFSYWGLRNRDRWYEDRWIKLEDMYFFRHTQRGINSTLSSKVHELKRKLAEYAGNGYALMTEKEAVNLGLDAKQYSWELG